jgi:hypothetical protein
MTTLPVSPAYREAVKVALILQVFATILLLLLLDGGVLAKVGGAAMVGFWIGVALVMIRRPRNPHALDLLYVRWGYVAMLLVGIAWMPFIGALPHGW